MKHINYTKHRRYGVAIIQAPEIFGKRLGYLSMENDSSWALRDYIGGVILRCGDSPTIKLSDIEAVVEEYWPAPYRSVNRRQEWTDDLENRSKNVFPTSYDASTAPSASWGPWQPLRCRLLIPVVVSRCCVKVDRAAVLTVYPTGSKSDGANLTEKEN